MKRSKRRRHPTKREPCEQGILFVIRDRFVQESFYRTVLPLSNGGGGARLWPIWATSRRPFGVNVSHLTTERKGTPQKNRTSTSAPNYRPTIFISHLDRGKKSLLGDTEWVSGNTNCIAISQELATCFLK